MSTPDQPSATVLDLTAKLERMLELRRAGVPLRAMSAAEQEARAAQLRANKDICIYAAHRLVAAIAACPMLEERLRHFSVEAADRVDDLRHALGAMHSGRRP